MVVTGGTAPIDSWDYPTPSSSLPSRHVSQRKVPKQHIPDDWDDDEDEEMVADESDNQKIWEDANKATPMPDLIISPSTRQPIVPPPSVFQPAMRILKRPSPTLPSSPILPDSSPSQDQQSMRNTLAEREAQYKAARNRIFGEGALQAGDPVGVAADMQANETLDDGKTMTIATVRDPLGPSTNGRSHTLQKGLDGRSGNKAE